MSNQKPNILISVDVETTGESPGTSSCVMIGCVVFKNSDINPETAQSEWVVDKRRWSIKEVPGRPMSDRCRREFWDKNKDLDEYIKSTAVEPSVAMADFAAWYADLISKYNCKFIARPASFDWQWLNCIYDEFAPANKPPLPYSITCLSTILKMLEFIGVDYDTVIKPLFDHPTIKLTHYADDDALYQAYMYLRVVHWMKKNIQIKN